jgi:hypothetical protein
LPLIALITSREAAMPFVFLSNVNCTAISAPLPECLPALKLINDLLRQGDDAGPRCVASGARNVKFRQSIFHLD